jgi:hypothetical protein
MSLRFRRSLEDLFLFTAFLVALVFLSPELRAMFGRFVGLFQQAR